jgi:L-histidine N-alpha-methyltransferase
MSHPASDVEAIEELREALGRDLPEIPSKYFYDDRGMDLFEAITRTPEYYPTRTEEAILETHADAIVAKAHCRSLAELGSGTGRKIRLLLDAMRRAGGLEAVRLMDINASALDTSVRALKREYPGLDARGVLGDFERDLERLGPGGDRLILFLAGTVGNLHPDRVPGFLGAVAAIMEPSDHFLLGVDLVKEPSRLHAAYDDAAGVTAEFNRNVLRVLNRRFGADFDPDAWEHVALYDPRREWIEMRLRAREDQHVRIPSLDVERTFRAGDEIRTEISCKFTRASLERRLAGTGLHVVAWYTDPASLFADVLLARA